MANKKNSYITFCILIKDAVSGRIISDGDVTLRVNGAVPRQIKNHIFHLFQADMSSPLEIQADSRVYETRKYQLSLSSGGEVREAPGGLLLFSSGMQIYILFMYPGKACPLPDGCRRYVVQASENIHLVRDGWRCQFLQEEYREGDILSLQAGDWPEGNYYRILDRSGGWEDFTVLEGLPSGQSRIYPPLQKRYPRGSRIFSLYHAVPDMDGYVVLIGSSAENISAQVNGLKNNQKNLADEESHQISANPPDRYGENGDSDLDP